MAPSVFACVMKSGYTGIRRTPGDPPVHDLIPLGTGLVTSSPQGDLHGYS